MKTYGNLIEVYEKAIPSALCQKIIKYFDNNENLVEDSNVASYTDEGGYEHKLKDPLDYRKSKQITLKFPEEDTNISNLTGKEKEDFDLLKELTNHMAPSLQKYMKIYPRLLPFKHTTKFESVNLLKYKSGGGWYKFHVDNDGVFISKRLVSIIIYLNDVEEGGETEFEYMDVDPIKPKQGDILIFPSGAPYSHRGNMPVSNNKYIAVFWLNKDKEI